MSQRETVSILGCGWYGFPLAELLLKNGYLVKGSTTTPDKLEVLHAKGIDPYLVDLSVTDDHSPSFWTADRLIITIPPKKDAATFQMLTLRLADKVKQQGYSQVILISSTSVYPDLNRVVTEKDASYGLNSRSGINLHSYEDAFDPKNLCVIRFGGLFGQKRHPVKNLSGREILGPGLPVNLIHLSDCLAITLKIIERSIVGERFNACHPDHPTKQDYYTRAAQALGIPPPTFKNEDTRYKLVSSEKLVRTIDYQFPKKLQIT